MQIRWKASDVAAQHLDEEQLHQAAKHVLAARLSRGRERKDFARRRRKERADFIFCGVFDEKGRQSTKHWREQEFGQFQKSTHEAGRCTAAAVVDRPNAFDRSRPHNFGRVSEFGRVAAPEFVLARERHQQQIAGHDRAPFAILQFECAGAFGDQVEDADVTQPRHRRALVPAPRADHAEWGRERAAQKYRAGQAHGLQHLRQYVDTRRCGGAIRRIGKGTRRLGHWRRRWGGRYSAAMVAAAADRGGSSRP